MQDFHRKGSVDWKLLLALVLLFCLSGSVIFLQKRIKGLERDLSLVRYSLQNLENNANARRLSFSEQYGQGELRLNPSQKTATNRPPAILSLRKALKQPRSDETPQEMLTKALTGDTTALDRLDTYASTLIAESSNSEQMESALAQLRAGFATISEEAAGGNTDALGLLWRATRRQYLAGIATDAIGHAAALGNEMALELLLNPEQYGILLSSAVGALVEVAAAGNELAIEALVSIALDESKRALWYLALSGLQPPAEAGNELAIQTLAGMMNSNDPNLRSAALAGLEAAAANGFGVASDALARLETAEGE